MDEEKIRKLVKKFVGQVTKVKKNGMIREVEIISIFQGYGYGTCYEVKFLDTGERDLMPVSNIDFVLADLEDRMSKRGKA